SRAQRAAHRVEEPEVVLLAGQRRRGAVAGEGRGEVGEVGGVGLRQREVLTRQVPPERLAPRPVRRGAGDLPAPSPQHPRARRRGARRELRDQPRLADTRIPATTRRPPCPWAAAARAASSWRSSSTRPTKRSAGPVLPITLPRAAP